LLVLASGTVVQPFVLTWARVLLFYFFTLSKSSSLAPQPVIFNITPLDHCFVESVGPLSYKAFVPAIIFLTVILAESLYAH